MSEKPILFSGPMVQAILAGRKTQTRRVIKPLIPAGYRLWWRPIDNHFVWTDHQQGEKGNLINLTSPYQPGDLLWVRESWCPANSENGPVVCYRADLHRRYLVDESYPVDYDRFPAGRGAWICWASDLESGTEGAWRPSIFMPRWASRITLRVTNVRAQHLQDISEEDAKAEGISAWHDTTTGTVYRPEFQLLWDSINAKRGYSWASNPWVWAVTFEQVKEPQ